MNRLFFFLLIALVFFLVDCYVWQAVRHVIRGYSDGVQRSVSLVYWGVTAVSLLTFITLQLLPPDSLGRTTRTLVYAAVMIPYFSKLFTVLILLIDDLIRFFRWVASLLFRPDVREAADDVARPTMPRTDTITRSDFLVKTSLVIGAIPFAAFSYGILSGAHDYRVRRVRLPLKNLPKAFDGMKIAQISDIHSGSFFNKTAVRGGVDLLLKQKPDAVFFTGDLVNSHADEIHDYFDVFNKVKAPLGVYSTLGNHDYGKYVRWDSPTAERENLLNVVKAHKLMGWDILMDENRILKVDGETLAIIGVQNLGFGPAALRAGNLAKAHAGTQDQPVKLLLSHDPTHWDAEVRPKFSDIDVQFSGHTHGAQFGVELGPVRWSPTQYFYRQWAGLYQEGDQRLYVNRGYGYIGYPGRVGILPEITLFELVKA